MGFRFAYRMTPGNGDTFIPAIKGYRIQMKSLISNAEKVLLGDLIEGYRESLINKIY